MNRGTWARSLLISTLTIAFGSSAALARGFGGGHVIGDYLLNGGGAPGNGIGYYNGSFGGYGGYGGFRGGGFGPYGGFNGADFRGYLPGGPVGYPSYGVVTSFARPPAFQPPHLITTEPVRRPEAEQQRSQNVGEAGVHYHGVGGGASGRIERATLDLADQGAVARRPTPGVTPLRPRGFNAYSRHHVDWLHGYWNGHRSAAWAWRSPHGGVEGYGAGVGMGWGLPRWGVGSLLYGMGFASYTNPYYSNALASASPYNYGQPIDTAAAPADAATVTAAETIFSAARAAFKQENYGEALSRIDAALKQLPDDPAIHEFRGLCLFALARYDEAAATLYAVLSVEPGWDWTTLVRLYPDVDVYTAQLRALEAYCRSHESAQAWFVLAYQYLTQGFPDAAVTALKHVVRRNPADGLSSSLLRRLDAPQPAGADAPPPNLGTAPDGATIVGTWTASPGSGLTVALTMAADGGFTWTVAADASQAPPRTFSGRAAFDDDLLTLVQKNGSSLVGWVSWTDPSRMTLRIVGEGPDDPGLSFSK